MKEHKMTHTGVIEGCDARTPRGKKYRLQLRETKLYWIGKHGEKYSKSHNGRTSGDWPLYRLNLETITKIEETEE